MATPVNQAPVYQSPFNKQRLDKFLLVFSVPQILRKKIAPITRKNSKINFNALQFSIYGVVTPQIAVPPVAIPYAGQTVKVTSFARPSYPQLSINFTVDNMFSNYWVLYKWLDAFNDASKGVYDPEDENILSTRDGGLADQYMTNLTIYGLDEFNERTVQFDYNRAFPVNLGGINYNDRNAGEMECTFEFAYHQLKMTLIS